jgi:transmembrane sensor
VATSEDDLQATAAQWLIRLDAGTADGPAFEAWRSDPRHAVAFAQAQAAWERMAQPPADTTAPDDGEPAAAPMPAEPRLSRRMLLRAASIAVPVLAIGGGAAVLVGRSPAYAATAVGEQRRFTPLPGFTVELNTDSRIGWQASGSRCELWLERGEAALMIEGREGTSALLHCAGREMLLAPGSYNARSDGALPGLVVIEGRAALRGTATAARAGEAIRLEPGHARLVAASPEALDAAAAWRRGEIVFNGETLGTALAEYNRYLERKLVPADAAVAALRVGGRFETSRPEAFLAALQSALGLEVVRREGDVLLRRKNLPPQ